MSSIAYADSLTKIYQAFRNQPLSLEDLDRFYCDTTEARGENTRKRIARILRQDNGDNEQIILVGYKGCGKSTELKMLEQELASEFLTLNISVYEELDSVHLNYIELFIVTMEKLFDTAFKKELPIKEELLKSVQLWMASRELEEINEKYLGGEVETGAGFDLSYFLGFFSKFRFAAKSSQQLKNTLKQNIEPKLGELIGHCNNLIADVRLQLFKKEKKNLLIILEDLDKIPYDRAQELFFNYTPQLTQLRVNAIYTFPISLYYNVKFNLIKTYFTKTYELPMIKVHNIDGSDNADGMETMQQIVAARMNIDRLFADRSILTDMIRTSGGVLRDLFLLIGEAAESAMDHDREVVNTEDAQKALYRLRKDYDNNIADNRIGDVLFTAENYYLALQQLAENPLKRVENTEEILHLRQNLCILGYNGEGWCDVHPIVVNILKDRGRLS